MQFWDNFCKICSYITNNWLFRLIASSGVTTHVVRSVRALEASRGKTDTTDYTNMEKRNSEKKKTYKQKDEIDRWETKNELYNRKLAFYTGDITKLALDAIVNAANSQLAGGGGVDGAIHREVGHGVLQKECRKHKRCDPGKAVITQGFDRPAKHIIHAVGPMDGNRSKLESCYETCFKLAKENNIKTIAFPCIATGIYGYPHEEAARIALSLSKKHLKENNEIELITFCLFNSIDIEIYENLKHIYFPGKDSRGRTLDELKKWSESYQTVQPTEDVVKYSVNSKLNEKIFYDQKESYDVIADAIINYGDHDKNLKQTWKSEKVVSSMKVDKSKIDIESSYIIRVKPEEGKNEENDFGKLYEICLNKAVKKYWKSLIIPMFHSDEFDEKICKKILAAIRSWMDQDQNTDKVL
ncbi:DgyrCDS12683 [Dimorphilus gyrociliatus]|uniref:DgyrCDS12683 n=1 Tax=Dimorphilus gyrociliatus TaxID=2664684 RepID=A0A7I8W780_9ANNE|nr:DgyrCDS12683 [Dimorphilus gyrociliatus]